ncbi:MAG: N-methylproline demethylase, partial [Alphaproteobacteria bacterium]|nr:N-methylproline demethylase [Alphaproteobacteria bacterium]
FDDNGGHQGMSAAEVIANAGVELELISPERYFAPEMGGMNHVPYAKTFAEKNVTVTINTRLAGVRRDGNRLVATLGSDFSDATAERRVAQVVVEHGTMANADLYFELKPLSRNRGAVDYSALVARRDPLPVKDEAAQFDLLRIGDAIESRNIHAAIYDALRYCSLL